MKVIITSDTHRNREAILAVVAFAKKHGIDTVLDVGDLHGAIEAYDGVRLYATYWEEAIGAMPEEMFAEEVAEIGGTVLQNASVLKLGEDAFFMQHDLVGHEEDPPVEIFAEAVSRIGKEVLGREYVLFGHTHYAYLKDFGTYLAINPGCCKAGVFAVLDTDDNALEFFHAGSGMSLFNYNSDNQEEISGFRVVDDYEWEDASKRAYIIQYRNGKEKLLSQDYVSEAYDKIVDVMIIYDGSVSSIEEISVLNDGKEEIISL